MNGISSLQGDFLLKDCPITHYFSFRCLIILNIIVNKLRYSLLSMICHLWINFLRFNLSYHYDSANVIVLAIKNILKGPDYLLEDINTSKIREYVKKKIYK